MASFVMPISSDQDFTPGNHADFEVPLTTAIKFGDIKMKCALSGLTMWSSFNFVSSQNGNNTMAYSVDSGANWKQIVFQNGTYDIPDINATMQAAMQTNGDPLNINILNNDITGKAQVLFSPASTYRLDFQTMTSIVGSDGTILGDGTEKLYQLPNYPDLTNGFTNAVVHASFIQNSNGMPMGNSSDVLNIFNPELTGGNRYSFEPRFFNWISLNVKEINYIRIYITDQNNKILDLPRTVTVNIQFAPDVDQIMADKK